MLHSRSVLVILNPSSGRARPEAMRRVVAEAFAAAGADAEIRTTSGPGDGETWAAGAADEGFDVVVAAGGDGTVTSVATGLLRSGSGVPLGIVPLGTGNGLARVLRIPMDPAKAVAALAEGRVVDLDVIQVHRPACLGLFFLGAGLDAEINRDADAEAKSRLGFLAYVGATARNLWGRRNHRLELTVDGRREDLIAHTVTVFNAGRFAFAGFEVGPDVDPHDGMADLTVMRSPDFWRSLGAVLRLASGDTDLASTLRARRFRLDARPPLLVHVDGDVVGSTPLEAEVLPGALPVIAGRDYRYALPDVPAAAAPDGDAPAADAPDGDAPDGDAPDGDAPAAAGGSSEPGAGEAPPAPA